DVPSACRPRVFRQVAGDEDADLPGGLEAECRRAAGQRQIVVDSLWHVGDMQRAAGLLVNLAGGIRGIIAADGDELGNVKFAKAFEQAVHIFRVFGRVGARGSQNGATVELNAADQVDGQFADLGDVAFDEPLVSVLNADHFHAVVDGFDGDG